MKIPPANLWMIQPTQNSPRSLSSTATTEGKTDVERLRRSSLWFCRFFREIKQHILVIHSGRGDSELGLAAGAASEVPPSGNGAQATSAKAVKGAWVTWTTSSLR